MSNTQCITTVLISYSHKDKGLKRYVELQLKKICGTSASIISDEDAETGSYLHPEISKLINKADIVIPIITRNWLASHETRDELVRANERRRYIYPLVISSEIPNISQNELPHYLREVLYFNYDQNENNDLEVIYHLAERLKQFNDHWKRKAFEEIRKIGDAITPPEKPLTRQQEYASQELELLRKDLERLFKGEEFRKNVSYESNFLIHATPFFKSALKVYAVSIIKISSFWTDESAREAVVSYLREQSKGNKPIRRLFAFESPTEANRFKNVLEANYSHYGRSGGAILICSMSTYRSFLIKCGIKENNNDDEFKKDFGLLAYNHNNEMVYLEATLDPRQLVIQSLNPSKTHFYDTFIEQMETLSKLSDGEINKMGIAKWSPKFSKTEFHLEWANILKKIFTKTSETITHLVLINSNGNINRRNRVYEVLLDIKTSFQDHKTIKNINIIDLSITKNLDHSEGVDGRFFSHLKIESKYDFAFVVQLPSREDLENYYHNELHSQARQKLYEIINPKVREIYRNIRAAGNINPHANNKFKEIEEEMKDYIIRLDFTDNLPVEYIAQQKGIEFGKIKY